MTNRKNGSCRHRASQPIRFSSEMAAPSRPSTANRHRAATIRAVSGSEICARADCDNRLLPIRKYAIKIR